MPEKILTIIIPFLNEKYEVENTVKSIKTYSTDRVEIMLINDASDDNFDYKILADKYDIIYIENTEREGVAASRDMGIEKCRTPYFLLLDAHMRFYDHLWEQRIIDELEEDKRALLCCQTKVLGLEAGLLVEPKDQGKACGACVELNEGVALIDPYWIYGVPFDVTQLQTFPIVCVLGATYACNKEYWQYLRGLEGLKYYGSDEPYISMKVWMEGGSCKLLKDVVIGHIYRANSTPPYYTQMKFRLFNKLFIAELFFPEELKKALFSKARFYFSQFFSDAMYLLHDNKEFIEQSKSYYKKIFTRDFYFFEELNNKYHKKYMLKDRLFDSVDSVLSQIALMLTERLIPDVGLLKGRMGIAIFLFHYSRTFNDEQYKLKAEDILKHLLADIKADTHYGFCTGLCGIGWGIEYLYQEGFVEGDTNEILADFDKKIMEIDPERMTNLNQDYGFSGIVLYLLARLYTVKKESKKNPFDEDYLNRVLNEIHMIITKRIACERIDVLLKFMNYYEIGEEINKPNILDICDMLNPKNIPMQDLEPGLRGVAGIGLRLIFEKEKSNNIDIA